MTSLIPKARGLAAIAILIVGGAIAAFDMPSWADDEITVEKLEDNSAMTNDTNENGQSTSEPGDDITGESAGASASASASASVGANSTSSDCASHATATASANADGETVSQHDEDHATNQDGGCSSEASASATATTGND